MITLEKVVQSAAPGGEDLCGTRAGKPWRLSISKPGAHLSDPEKMTDEIYPLPVRISCIIPGGKKALQASPPTAKAFSPAEELLPP